MDEIRSISIIGAGCVGDFMATEMYRKGFIIHDIISRRKEAAQSIASKVQARTVPEDFITYEPHSDLYILSVKDDVIMEYRKKIHLGDRMIVHTSGSVPMEALKTCAKRYGVLYPFQTFSRERKMEIDHIPFFIEANDNESEKILTLFIKKLSDQVFMLSGNQRTKLHMAGVFASNFVNHLFRISKEILDEEGIDHEVLKPLAYETLGKIFEIGPENSQTGPAKRGDCNIIDKHIELLKDKDQKKLYGLISKMIKKYYKKSI